MPSLRTHTPRHARRARHAARIRRRGLIVALLALVAATLAPAAASADPLATPSPTAGTPALHEFYIESVPPPMPLDPAARNLAGGPVAKVG
jgi:hypothetical protein